MTIWTYTTIIHKGAGNINRKTCYVVGMTKAACCDVSFPVPWRKFELALAPQFAFLLVIYNFIPERFTTVNLEGFYGTKWAVCYKFIGISSYDFLSASHWFNRWVNGFSLVHSVGKFREHLAFTFSYRYFHIHRCSFHRD